MNEYVSVSSPEPGVCLIRLDQPDTRNALGIAMRQAISTAVSLADVDETVACIVLTGGESCFSAGADLEAVIDYGAMDMARARVERYWQTLQDCSKPIIAAVNGYALGGGCELAMLADVIIAGRGAIFGQPEVKLGIMPGSGATQRLPRAVGKYRAMKILLSGEPFPAEEALAMGLVSTVVEDSKVLAEALALAAQIATHPGEAVRRIKEVVLAGADMSLDSALLLERQSMHLLFDTAESKQRMRALLALKKRGR